jgi:hypothetical protein
VAQAAIAMQQADARMIRIMAVPAPTRRLCGSGLLSQIRNCSPTSIPLVEAGSFVGHGTIDFNQKNVGLAGSTACHEYLRRIVFCNFEHSLTHR